MRRGKVSVAISASILSTFVLLMIAQGQLRAQDAIAHHFTAHYEAFLGAGLPAGLSVGGRLWTGRDAGIELGVGTLISAFTFSAGVDFSAPSLFADTRPSWTLLGTYYRGADARWIDISAMYGLLQLGLTGLHMYARGGASLLIKSSIGPNAGLLFYPLPAFDVGLSWGFE